MAITEKKKKHIALNNETKKILEELSRIIGVNENSIVAMAIHRFNKDFR